MITDVHRHVAARARAADIVISDAGVAELDLWLHEARTAARRGDLANMAWSGDPSIATNGGSHGK